MPGFFSNSKFKKQNPLAKLPQCGRCKLYKHCDSPKMEPYGEGKKKILIIGDAPGEFEDNKNIPLDDNLISPLLKKVGINYKKDCLTINALSCFHKGGVRIKQIEYCRPKVWKVIKQFKPKLIILLGLDAVHSFIGHRMKKNIGKMEKWIGWEIPDRESKCWVIPVNHPRSIKQEKDLILKFLLQDLEKAIKLLDKSFIPYDNEQNQVKTLTNPIQIVELLQGLIMDPRTIAVDYETTGLKPHKDFHYIKTCAISQDSNSAWAFPVGNNRKVQDALADVMEHPEIYKVAANMKFEELWTREILGVETSAWIFDTMQAAHVLDNRPGITSVKFQAYVRYGLIDYNSHIDFGESKDANEKNKIEEIDLEDLLIYNGIDTILEYRLFEQQAIEIHAKKLDEAYNLIHEGTLALCDVEENGIFIDVDYVEKKMEELDNKAIKLKNKILKTDVGKKWKQIYKDKTNVQSDDQLRNILFDQMKIKPKKKTKNGAPSLDVEALEKINLPVTKALAEYRINKKMRDTYLEGIYREQVDGILHSFFNLHIPRTYRGSSSNINFQNQPIRDPIAGKTIRQAFIPAKGNQLLEVDFKGIEVSIACCYHQDPMMHKYITNPKMDMHRDMAGECYILENKEVTKDTRYCGKNKFVFPQFYGDYYVACAKSLWEAIDIMKLKTVSGIPLKEHLRDEGIISIKQFEDHLKEVEEEFWHERFEIYTQWKDEWYEEYLKVGFIRMKTGFICSGLMRKNQVINYPVQGAAFHCLLWCLIELNKWLKQNQMKTCIIGQIHDSLIIDLYPKEKKEVFKKIKYITTVGLRKHFTWITLPMEIEAEITPIDGNWFEKKEIQL